MRRIGSILALIVFGSFWLPGVPDPALAGDVNARLCPGTSTARFPGSFEDGGGRPWLEIGIGCHAAGNGVASLQQDRDGASAGFAQGGSIVWGAPPEVSIIRATGRVRMKDANGIRTALIGRAGSVVQKIGEGSALDGSEMDFTWPRSGTEGTALEISIACRRTDGCSNGRNSTRSFVQMERLDMTGRDETPPSVDPSGDFLEASSGGRWAGPSVGWGASARDVGTGLADVYFLVNGFPLGVPKISCLGLAGGHATELSPCPSVRHQTGVFDTTEPPFREGLNSIRLCAVDFASDPGTANRGCSVRSDMEVDTERPLPPSDLRTDRGPGWSARERFAIAWSLPDDRGSPLDRAFYRLRSASTGLVASTGEFRPDSGQGMELTVREPGDYRLEVGLVDAAGNRGGVATTPIRFDDRPPADVSPVVEPGWVSRPELPLPVSVESTADPGQSGIAGYALEASDFEPRRPCGSSLCRLSEISWLGGPDEGPALLSDLSEGQNFVSAVAVSGAMVPSRHPGVTSVKVDLTDPVVRVTGNSQGWSNRPVTLSAIASDRLSGMAPDPDDEDVPVTGIGVVGSTPEVTKGDRSTVTITREGRTEIEYFARDLAGNSTDGREGADPVVIRIDTTPPAIGFGLPGDPDDPERAVAFVDDEASGVIDGEISVGPKGEKAGFRTLPTEVTDGRLEADVPSEVLPPGDYVLRAEATDAAGNRSSVTSGQSFRLPLKAATSISLERGGAGRGKALPASSGTGVVVSGRVSSSSGRLGLGSTVSIEEVFPAGAGLETRTTPVPVGSDGTFSVELEPGPSRRVRAFFAGDRLHRSGGSGWVALTFSDRITFSVRDRVTRNGAPTRMVGKVSGRGVPMPFGGKKVVIQYFDPSRRAWRPVEVVTAGSSGRFTFTYRFRTITSRQEISFRAASLGEAGWPFRPSASRPVVVIVLP